MKTKSIIVLLSFLYTLTGCVNEDIFTEKDSSHYDNKSLTAIIENQNLPETRTIIDEEGNTYWVETDRLGVFGTKTAKNKPFVYDKATSNKENPKFTGKLSDDPTEEIKWAYYPYNKDNYTKDNEGNTSLHFTIPSVFEYTGESQAPMLAIHNQHEKFAFKYLGGVLKIILGEMPQDAKRLIISSLSGKDGKEAPNISGAAKVNNIYTENAIYEISTDGEKTITYDISALNTNNDYCSFFIPIPTGLYPKLEVKLVKEDGTPYFTRTISNRQIDRATMIEMPILNAQTGECYILNKQTIEITSDLESSISLSTENPSTLIYKNVNKSQLPIVGNILLKKEITNKFPQGFLGKVTSVKENNDGSYTIYTENAQLDEAFKELYVNETIDISPVETRSPAFERDEDGYICFKLTMEDKSEGNLHYGKGELTLGIKFTPYISISEKNNIKSFTIQMKAEYSGDFGFKGEFEDEIFKTKLGNGFFLPVFNAGPLVITPKLQPYFIIQPSGAIELSTNIAFSSENVVAVEFKNGKRNQNCRPLKNGKKPWDIGGKFKLSGELMIGASAALEGKLYNQDFFCLAFESQAGYKLLGDIDLFSLASATNKEELLSSISAKHQGFISGEFKLETKFPNSQQKISFKLPEFIFMEKDLWVIPEVEKPQTTVNKKKDTFEAEAQNGIHQELLTKQTVVKNVLKNQEDEILQEGKEIQYTSDPISENNENQDVTQNLNDNFINLKSNSTYKIQPVINSPLLDEPLVLTSKTSTIRTESNSLREQLIQLYHNNNGKNWKHKDNWCSDTPLEEWYGIETAEIDGSNGYIIDLQENELTGDIQLSDSTILILAINGSFSSLDVSGCTNLIKLTHIKESLKELNVAGCKRLQLSSYDCQDIQSLEVLNISNCTAFHKDIIDNQYSHVFLGQLFKNLKKFIAQNRLDIGSIYAFPNTLEKLDLAGCTNANIAQGGLPSNLHYLDLSQCDSVKLQYGIPFENLPNLEYLYLNDYNHPDGTIIDFDFYRKPFLKEFTARNANLHELYYRRDEWETNPPVYIDLSGCNNLKKLYVSNNPISYMNLKSCSYLKELSVTNCQLTSTSQLPISNNLEYLDCSGNLLTSLYLNECKQLKGLQCIQNQLSNIDVSSLKELKYLNCSNNPTLRSFNTNGCKLKELTCCECGFTTLKLRHLSNTLINLHCSDNQLTKLDLRECPNLIELRCQNNQLDKLDFTVTPNIEYIDCSNNSLTLLDVSNHATLKHLEFKKNPLESINISNCTGFSPTTWQYLIFDAGFLKVKKLNVSNNPELHRLYIDSNHTKISELNLSNCPNLKAIDLDGNHQRHSVNILNVANCTSLDTLICNTGQLAQLDITNCTQLSFLDCSKTILCELDVSTCSSLLELDCSDNPQLTNIHLRPNHAFETFDCAETKITKEIPQWLERQFAMRSGYYNGNYIYYNYDNRYLNYRWNTDYYPSKLEYTDLGYGWWFKGEPEHRPN